jgi:hypothetical protein
MELHLGLALSTYNSCAYDATTKIHDFPFNHNTNTNKKRSFSQLVFEHAAENSSTTNFPTLSLLPLTPGHSDDHDHQHCSHSSNTTITK